MDYRDLCNDLDSLADAIHRCFLCGRHLSIVGQTDEHVVPAWAQRRFDLWNQKLGLLNDTLIPYRQLTVPCCDECNTFRLRSLEDSLCQTVDLGRNAVLALGHKTLFLWLGKIFYGILYREMLLLADRARPASGTIITEEFISQFGLHRLLLQQARELIEMKEGSLGSIFVFNAQQLPDRKMEWDLADNVDTHFICVRAGRVALFGILGDGGAQQSDQPIYNDLTDLLLHPIQIRELCARFSYRSTCATRDPKYIVVANGRAPHSMFQQPLGGLSRKPYFEPWDPQVYAQFLSHYTGIPLDGVYQKPDKTRTWLHDDHGNVLFIPFHQFPYLPAR